MKKENHILLIIIIAILLVVDLIFAFYTNFEGAMIVDIVLRFSYSIVIILMIMALRLDVLKPKNLHLLWLAIPALLVSINNFPIIAFFNEKTTLTASDTDVYMFLMQSVSIGLFEELIFRGLMLAWILDYLKDTKHAVLKSMFISSALFGLVHLLNIFAGASFGQTILQMLYTTLTGLMWSAVLVLTKNIWTTVVLHIVYNIAGLFFPTLGQVIGQWDIWTVSITIGLSIVVAAFYLYHILKIKTYNILVIPNQPNKT